MEAVRIEDLIDIVERGVENGNPLDYLAESVVIANRLDDLSDELIGYFVDLARESGASWAEIGGSLGVSKQAAQKRFVLGAGRGGRGLFTRFATQAREIVTHAVSHATRAGHYEIGTGHLVLGIIDHPDSIAARAMVGLGVSLDRARTAVQVGLPPNASGKAEGHIPFSDHAKKVLQLALREAIRSGDRHIGSEHILLAILRDQGSSGAEVLTSVGLSRGSVEEWLSANR